MHDADEECNARGEELGKVFVRCVPAKGRDGLTLRTRSFFKTFLHNWVSCLSVIGNMLEIGNGRDAQ